jgi:hypothetical protein
MHNGEKFRTIKIYALKDFLYKDRYIFKKFAAKGF